MSSSKRKSDGGIAKITNFFSKKSKPREASSVDVDDENSIKLQNEISVQTEQKDSPNVMCESENVAELEEIATRQNNTNKSPCSSTCDIKHYVHKAGSGCNISNLSVQEKYAKITNIHRPSYNYKFPSTIQNKQNRSFKHSWLLSYKWLEYSEIDDGGYCRACVFFAMNDGVGKGNHELAAQFIKEPFRNFRKGVEKCGEHSEKLYHNEAMGKMLDLLDLVENRRIRIEKQIDTQREETIQRNKKKLIPVARTVILCGRQNIALRGHRDDGPVLQNEPVNNDGNFRSILRYGVDSGDTDLENHLQTAPKNATFTSKTSQNDMINVCGVLIQEKVVVKVKVGKYFVLIGDGTTDVEGEEQESLCVRYIDFDLKSLAESFICFYNPQNTTGICLSRNLLQKLADFGLDVKYLRGQAYDGAPNMSGYKTGCQALIKEIQPKAIYTHCVSHNLNLGISKSCKEFYIERAHEKISETITFIGESSNRMQCLEDTYNKSEYTEPFKKLTNFCDTRFIQRHDSVLRFDDLFVCIINCLQFLDNITKGKANTAASGLLHSLSTFVFIYSMKTLVDILAITVQLSRQLQEATSDIALCIEQSQLILSQLKKKEKTMKQRAIKYF